MPMKPKIVCFGEVLWDVLPTQKIAGGAPMNVAIRLQWLGIDAQIISSIGADAAGEELLKIISSHHVNTELIQINAVLPTGLVLVALDAQNNASYDIVKPSAWDNIALLEANMAATKNVDAFVFGSLACRDSSSKNTLFELLKVAKYKIFDVNIRPPFYDMMLIKQLMTLTDFVKLNDDELLEIAKALGSDSEDLEANILFLAAQTHTNAMCITKGANGAVLWVNNQFYTHAGYQVRVADTIGAGDGFLAGLISKMIEPNATDYAAALGFGCAVGAAVAARSGANPTLTPQDIHALQNPETK